MNNIINMDYMNNIEKMNNKYEQHQESTISTIMSTLD
jgi:hypothetical protein